MEGKSLLTNLKRFYYMKAKGDQTVITIGGFVTGLLASFGAKQGLKISKEIAWAVKDRMEK
jgi:hypothetical protein